MSTKVPNTLLY